MEQPKINIIKQDNIPQVGLSQNEEDKFEDP
jgi:hypothetical protein